MNDELTRLRLEVIRLQYEFGVVSAENRKLRVMLDAALETKSRAIDEMAREAIEKARKS
jgi:hypothetical protein